MNRRHGSGGGANFLGLLPRYYRDIIDVVYDCVDKKTEEKTIVSGKECADLLTHSTPPRPSHFSCAGSQMENISLTWALTTAG